MSKERRKPRERGWPRSQLQKMLQEGARDKSVQGSRQSCSEKDAQEHLMYKISSSEYNSYPAQFFFFFFFNKFIYLFIGGVGFLLRCTGFSLQWPLPLRSVGSRCVGFSSCGSRALECRLSSCGAWAQPLCGMWDLPRPGLEPKSPALAGGFSTTAPPGKSHSSFF